VTFGSYRFKQAVTLFAVRMFCRQSERQLPSFRPTYIQNIAVRPVCVDKPRVRVGVSARPRRMAHLRITSSGIGVQGFMIEQRAFRPPKVAVRQQNRKSRVEASDIVIGLSLERMR